MYEMKRNPSFTPSPQFREWLNKKINKNNAKTLGPTGTLNDLFDRFRAMVDLNHIKLTAEEQSELAAIINGVWIDEIAIQAISQDVEPGTSLHEKLSGASFGQVWATLEKYDLI